MKKRKNLILLFTLHLTIISNIAFAQEASHIIFFYRPYTDSSETNLYEKITSKFDYNTQYYNIKGSNIINDLDIALKHNDYRFISIQGFTYVFPGLMGYIKDKKGNETFGYLKNNAKYLKKYKFKVIQGTSDAIDSSKPPLQNVAGDYAEKYNKALLVKIKELENIKP